MHRPESSTGALTMQQPRTARGSQGLLVAVLLAQITFGLLTMTLHLPSMQDWTQQFGAELSSVQLTFSGYAIAFGSLQLLYGPLSDRYGRRTILYGGLLLSLAGSLLGMAAASLPVLITARVLQGAGTAAGMVVGRALVQDLFQGPARTRMMAYIGMVMGLCPTLSVLIGGQLHVRLGWQANFVLVALLALLLMLATWRLLPAQAPSSRSSQHWLRAMLEAYGQLARERRFLLYVAILALTYATFYAYLGGSGIVLGSYGVGPEDVGWYMLFMSLSYFVGNFGTSRLIHRVGERALMGAGQLLSLSGIGLMLVLGLSGWPSPLAFALPLVLLGIGHGFLMPPALAGTVGAIPLLAGSAAAVAGLMQQLMGALGGYSVGLVSHHGSANLAALMLVFTTGSVVAQVALHWNSRRQS